MSLSVSCRTRGPGDRVAAMLALLRPVADEILVLVDDRTEADVDEPLARVADRLIRYPYAEPVDRPRAWMHAECRGEWVLTIDDDEIPSRALLDALPDLVRARDVTHYWLPRRWLYPAPDRYLDARPWRPDYQARLVLNDPRLISFPAEMHVPLAALGPCRYLDAPLYHADCLLTSTEVREAKAKRYERLRPGRRVAGRPLNEAYYLPERVDAPTREVPGEDLVLIAEVFVPRPPGWPARAEVRVADRAEIDRHWAGRELVGYDARLTLLQEVPALRAGAVEKVDVLVENLGADSWPWGGAGGPEIRIGSRWLQHARSEEGPRTPLPADLPPGGWQIVPVALAAPAEPGHYTLELDLVHEDVRWFDRPVGVMVAVVPARFVAVLDPGSLDDLVAALETLDPEEEPLVVTHNPRELARSFAGAVRAAPEGPGSPLDVRRLRAAYRAALAGAERLVVPTQLLQEGRRQPLLAAVSAARALGIPAHSTDGTVLTQHDVARRRIREPQGQE